jgi:hypothetical protein
MSKSMGLTLEVDQAAMAQLPYGEMTQLTSVQLAGMSWREALNELLKPLGLTFQTGIDRIYILGSKELMQQPRRLNVKELEAVVLLQNSNLNNGDKNILRQLGQVTRLNFRLFELDQLMEKADEEAAGAALIATSQPASKVLDLYSRAVMTRKYKVADPAGWYVQIDEKNVRAEKENIDIVIQPMQRLNAMKLERRIDFSFRNVPVQTMLQEIARQGAFEIHYEPGCFSLLNDDVRNNCSLVMRSALIREALEALAGMTGLTHTVTAEGIYISAGETLRQAAAKRGGGGAASPTVCPIVVKIPGTDMETIFFLTEEELKKYGVWEKYKQLQEKSIRDYIQFLQKYNPNVIKKDE